jgi:hypothetical protein
MSQKRRKNSCYFRSSINVICLATALLLVASMFQFIPNAFAVDSILRATEQVYVPGEELVLYGKSNPDDILIAQVFDPAGRAIRIDNLNTDKDGFFRESLFEWPQPSKNLPFGVYTILVTPSKGLPLELEVTFAEASPEGTTPRTAKTHALGVKMDSPAQVPIGSSFRIFVQVTFDGALVDSDDLDLLESSHIHSGRGNSTINISGFVKLHEGLYYADVKLDTEGTYVIHTLAFYRGYLSHDSRVVTASASSLDSLQSSVNKLDARLNSTNQDLEHLETRLDDTRQALSDTEASITKSLNEAQSSIEKDIGEATLAVEGLQDASGQVNSIILPVLALISVIIALQISLFARIRASYR